MNLLYELFHLWSQDVYFINKHFYWIFINTALFETSLQSALRGSSKWRNFWVTSNKMSGTFVQLQLKSNDNNRLDEKIQLIYK